MHANIAGPGMKVKNRKALQAVLSVLPVIMILLGVRVYPIISDLQKSFTDWDGLFQKDWVGLSNYILIFTDGTFWNLLKNNLILLINVPLQVVLGLIVAVLLYEEVWGWKIFRALYYLPQIISAVIIGYLFKIFFGFNGPFNMVLSAVKLKALAINWFGNSGSALFIITLCLVWFSIGWQAIVILGGMSSIPSSIFEASKIDGANYWQRTFKIVLPMLVRVIEYGVILSVVWTFTSLFPFIYAMTKGGPGYGTMTFDYMIYDKAFASGSKMGYACALSIILFLIILVFTIVEMKAANKMDDWSE